MALPDSLTGVLDRLTSIVPPRTDTRRWLLALAAAGTVGTTAVGLILLSPLPGRSASPWLSMELELAVPPPPLELPNFHEPRQLAGAEPVLSPPVERLAQPGGELVGWAILDRLTGSIIGSDTMTQVSTTASMIKAWIAADYLRLSTETGRSPSSTRLSQLELVIRDSNNEYAEVIFREIGASDSINRLIEICHLTDSRAYRDFWSNTQLSPRDTARLGACIADGTAAGPEWTDWLLAEMRAVRGVGDFGIRHAFDEPERAGIAIKNGWLNRDYDGNWHVNCLAIGDTWTMGVMTRYPVHLGYEHGAQICQRLAAEHLPLVLAP